MHWHLFLMSVFYVVFFECKLVDMSAIVNQFCSVLEGWFDCACYGLLLSCSKFWMYHRLGLVLCLGSWRFIYYIRWRFRGCFLKSWLVVLKIIKKVTFDINYIKVDRTFVSKKVSGTICLLLFIPKQTQKTVGGIGLNNLQNSIIFKRFTFGRILCIPAMLTKLIWTPHAYSS